MAEHIRLRRGRYLVQIRVPRDLKHAYRAQFVERYLNTADKREARDAAPDKVAAIRAEFKTLREGGANVGAAVRHIREQATWRGFNVMRGDPLDGAAKVLADSLDFPALMQTARKELERRGEPTDETSILAATMALAIGSDNSRLLFEKGISPAEPGPFRRVAPSGEKVESAAHLAEYLATLGGSNERKTVDMKRSTIKKFCAEFPSTADIDRQGVQQWINREASKGAAPATIRRVMSEMRGYWKYLRAIRKVADESDPFDKLSIPAGGKTAKASERKPFGTADVLRLLAEAKARDDDELADLIEIAMWTGARLEEICALPVAKVNLTGRYLDIEDAKTPAGWRQVPVHAKLLPVLRRLIGERTSGYVLATLKPNKYGDRGAWIGKEFGKMKTAMGFGADRVFHSIRKTVATLLENAGVPEGVAADIVGHDKPTMTYGLYSGGASLATKAAAIKKLAYETKGKAPKD